MKNKVFKFLFAILFCPFFSISMFLIMLSPKEIVEAFQVSQAIYYIVTKKKEVKVNKNITKGIFTKKRLELENQSLFLP